MNREETKKAIEVMQAYVDGKTVQYRPFINPKYWHNGFEGSACLFDFTKFEYRIKPEPRVIEINENEFINVFYYGGGSSMSRSALQIQGPCRFVEVIDD